MKEVTRVITLEITDIVHLEDDEEIWEDTPSWRKMLASAFKDVLIADDVVITNVQDFEMDVEDCQDCKE